jgi:hypothetical protein
MEEEMLDYFKDLLEENDILTRSYVFPHGSIEGEGHEECFY